VRHHASKIVQQPGSCQNDLECLGNWR
jgi:hypothetical protein